MEVAHRLVPIGRFVVSLWLHTAENPGKVAFASALDEIAAQSFTPERLRNLVVTDGGAPDTAQRKLLTEGAWRKQPMKLAVVTTALDNPLKRGVATALAWLNPNIHFFRPEQFVDALEHIDLAAHGREIWDAYGALQRPLPPVANLKLIGERMGWPTRAPG